MCGTGEGALSCARNGMVKRVTVKGFQQRRGDEIDAWREGLMVVAGMARVVMLNVVFADEMRSNGGQQAVGVAAHQCNSETLFSDENMKHAQEMNAET